MPEKKPLGDRIFRFLLRIFPFDFRSDFGSEMQEVFREQRREVEADANRIGALRLWWETIAGILHTAPHEHWQMLKQDGGYALRMMGKNPGFTAVAALTLALGIGANTAIFSVVRGVLLRPLPYGHGERLVLLHQSAARGGFDDVPFSVKEIEDYRDQNRSFTGLVEYHSMWFTLLGGKQPQRIPTGVVSANFFDILDVKPILGRTFLPGEDRPNAPAVLVLSYAYWQRELGGDLDVIGRTFEMNDRVHTVVGVLPPLPPFPDENSVYMTSSSCPFRSSKANLENRDSRMLNAFARLKPGATLSQAQADLAIIASRLEAEYPKSYPKEYGYTASASPLQEELTRRARPTLLILLGTAGFVLLIACTNVANLTLARLTRRDREMAVRAALGASRARLVRQVLTESLLLALVGGALGLFLAYLGLDLLVAFAARLTPRADEIRLDASVLLFALVVSFATSFLFGLIAALPISGDLGAAMKEGSISVTSGRNRTRNALIVSQVALSFTLLIGAGLMTRSLIKLSNVDPGFNPENVLSMSISLNWTKYSQPKQTRDFYERLLERLKGLSGVRSAAVSMTFPLDTMGSMRNDLQIEGYTSPPGEPGPTGDFRDASSDYFETIGMPLLRGRAFTDSDNAEAPPVVIVNQSMARHYWGQRDPLGQRISFDDGKKWRTIVGVVGDVRQYGLASPVVDEVYVPFLQSPLLSASLLVRTAADPASIARDVIAVVHQIDPQQPVAHVQTLKQVRDDSLASPRLTAILLSLFAVLALVITAAGISGIVALAVSQRTHEIGIRMVLGATPADVLRMVLLQGMAPVLIGLCLGVVGALALTRVMSGLLFGIEPADPLTFVTALLVSAVIAAAACLWPARRATSIQPLVALRAE